MQRAVVNKICDHKARDIVMNDRPGLIGNSDRTCRQPPLLGPAGELTRSVALKRLTALGSPHYNPPLKSLFSYGVAGGSSLSDTDNPSKSDMAGEGSGSVSAADDAVLQRTCLHPIQQRTDLNILLWETGRPILLFSLESFFFRAACVDWRSFPSLTLVP